MATKKATGAATKKTAAKKSGTTAGTRTKAGAARPANSNPGSAGKAVAKRAGAAPPSRKAPAKKAAAKVPAKRSAPRKTSTSDKYTDPALRERIKAKVIREDKGGRAGQWSARKAQMVAHEYEAAGGKYRGGRDQAAQSLTEWGEEHWTTENGKPARRKDGMHRYLPEKAWEKLTPAEKRSTEKKKLAGDKQGKQFVANTEAAVSARRKAEKHTGKPPRKR